MSELNANTAKVKESDLSFKGAYLSLVSSAIDIMPAGETKVSILETGLHLNSRHRRWRDAAIDRGGPRLPGAQCRSRHIRSFGFQP